MTGMGNGITKPGGIDTTGGIDRDDLDPMRGVVIACGAMLVFYGVLIAVLW